MNFGKLVSIRYSDRKICMKSQEVKMMESCKEDDFEQRDYHSKSMQMSLTCKKTAFFSDWYLKIKYRLAWLTTLQSPLKMWISITQEIENMNEENHTKLDLNDVPNFYFLNQTRYELEKLKGEMKLTQLLDFINFETKYQKLQ